MFSLLAVACETAILLMARRIDLVHAVLAVMFVTFWR